MRPTLVEGPFQHGKMVEVIHPTAASYTKGERESCLAEIYISSVIFCWFLQDYVKERTRIEYIFGNCPLFCKVFSSFVSLNNMCMDSDLRDPNRTRTGLLFCELHPIAH